MKKTIILFSLLVLIIINVGCENSEKVISTQVNSDINKLKGNAFSDYIENLDSQVDLEETLAVIDSWIEANPYYDDFGYCVKGDYLYYAGYYYESIEPYKKAAELSKSSDNYYNLFYAYYNSDLIYKAEELYKANKKLFVDETGVKISLAQIYALLGEYEESIKILERILRAEPDNNQVIFELAASYYYYMADHDNALAYIKQYEKQGNDTDQLLVDIENLISNSSETIDDVSYLKDLFSDYYMFDSNYEVLDGISGDLSNREASQLINRLRDEDDKFTFLLYGENYNFYDPSDSRLDYKSLGKDVHYIKLNSFSKTVNYDFLKTVYDIEDTESSTLVIDLRDNSGGLLFPAVNILDRLIGEKILCVTKNKKRDDVIYESDASKIAFEEIYVLINGKSASSAELLALGLNTHLDNVTIVGEQSYGKGVGQSLIDDKINERKYVILNFMWYVKDLNIQDVGIRPEIILENAEIDDYMMTLLNLTEF